MVNNFHSKQDGVNFSKQNQANFISWQAVKDASQTVNISSVSETEHTALPRQHDLCYSLGLV